MFQSGTIDTWRGLRKQPRIFSTSGYEYGVLELMIAYQDTSKGSFGWLRLTFVKDNSSPFLRVKEAVSASTSELRPQRLIICKDNVMAKQVG